MLEGESLLNDATSLVLLRTAVAAIAVGSVPVGRRSARLRMGRARRGRRRRPRRPARAARARAGWRTRPRTRRSSFVVPFVAYLPTEQLGGSGLVAAVVAGIVTGQGAARWFTPEQRLSDELNWRTIELTLEGAVFLVMGLQLKEIVQANIEDHEGLWYGAWLAASALGHHPRRPRGLRRRPRGIAGSPCATTAPHCAPTPWRPRGRRRCARTTASPTAEATPASPRRRARHPDRMRDRVSRALADLDYHQSSPLGWKHGTVIVWAGMRGVVTLAAAQTLPRRADPGTAGLRRVPGRGRRTHAAGLHPAVARAPARTRRVRRQRADRRRAAAPRRRDAHRGRRQPHRRASRRGATARPSRRSSCGGSARD